MASCFTDPFKIFAEQSGILWSSGTGKDRVCSNNATAVLVSKDVMEETCRSRQYFLLEQHSSLEKLLCNQEIQCEILIRQLLYKMSIIC